jgi:DNA-directed RNA polymerase beta subunit
MNQRVDFGKIRHLAEAPDLLEVQIQSFKEFFQLETTPDKRNIEGLFRVFKENFPITDTRNIFVLEFLDYFIDPPRYTIEECMERGLTYAVPLKAKLRLSCNDEEHVDFQTIVPGCVPWKHSVHDAPWYFCYQWSRKGCCLTIASFTGCILRAICSPERNQDLLCKGYSI